MTEFNKPTLTELVDRIFAEGGLLSQLYGMEYREQQHLYALDVCQWLHQKSPSVAMLEGETGIGKSIAYLLPLAVHLSLTGKRALISTYTVHLIHQLNDDEGMVKAMLDHLELPPVAIANRLGRAQYISAGRLLALAEATEDPSGKKQLLALHKKIQKQYGPHVYVKYWSENAAGFNLADTESSIALTGHCSQEDAHWYQVDCEAASHASIVLTSHTCSMLYARGIPVFKATLPADKNASRRPLPAARKSSNQEVSAFTGSGQREAGSGQRTIRILDNR